MFEKKSRATKVTFTVTISSDVIPLINNSVKKLREQYPDRKVNKSTFTETAINQFLKSLDEVE